MSLRENHQNLEGPRTEHAAGLNASNWALIRAYVAEKGEVKELISVSFGKNVARVAVPYRHFRTWILGRERWQPSPRGIQILETFQFEVLAVSIHNQNVVDGI
jgi:hypothetical protein